MHAQDVRPARDRGRADAERNIRSFAVKFNTEKAIGLVWQQHPVV